jgi:ribonuclease HII
MLGLETLLGEQGHERIAGIDEAGRGPLAGPVFAAAVILPVGVRYEGLTDSKLLRPAERERWYERIHRVAVASAVAWVGPREIDAINILQATRKAMMMAVRALAPPPGYLLVDGVTPLDTPIPQMCVKQGDRRSQSIAAASILAKVSRDRLMEDLHRQYPRYNFSRNKGYGTREHLEVLGRYGASPEHRMTFRGVPGRDPGREGPAGPSLFGPAPLES